MMCAALDGDASELTSQERKFERLLANARRKAVRLPVNVLGLRRLA